MVSPATHWATVLGAYLRRGEDGLAAVEERVESTAHEQPEGKFGKAYARYLPQAPFPPTLWRTSCGRCRFWEEGEPGEPGQCHVVGREGDRFGGEAIHYRGWCAFWMPPAGEPPFAWVRERLRPDGKSSVRGVYDPAGAERERRRRRRERAIGSTGGRPPSSGVEDSRSATDDGDARDDPTDGDEGTTDVG